MNHWYRPDNTLKIRNIKTMKALHRFLCMRTTTPESVALQRLILIIPLVDSLTDRRGFRAFFPSFDLEGKKFTVKAPKVSY